MKTNQSWAALSDDDRLRLRFFLSQSCLLLALSSWMLEPITRIPMLILTWFWVLAGLVIPRWAGLIPERWAPWAGRVILGLVVLDFGLNWHDPLDPIMRMGLWLVWVRTLTWRTARESLQVLLIALIMIMLAGVISMEVSYALQLLVFSLMAMGFLILENTAVKLAPERGSDRVWRDFQLLPWLRSMLALLSARLVLAIVGLWIAMILGAALLFVVLPRFQFQSLLPGLRFGGDALTGFSESFDLNGLGSILESNQVVMRVDGIGSEWNGAPLYWRMLVLDGYESGRFFLSTYPRSESSRHQVTANLYIPGWMRPDPRGQEGEVWTAYYEGSISRYIPIPGSFRSMIFPHQQLLSLDSVFGTLALQETPSKTTVFQWVDLRPGTGFSSASQDRKLFELREPEWRDPAEPGRDQYPASTLVLKLNPEDRESLLSILSGIEAQGTAGNVREFASMALQYLANQHPYSLKPSQPGPGVRGRDPVVWWLNNKGQGHCEYFAGAFTLLARAKGYPCRIVTGFAGGDWVDGSQPYLLVRQRHAHAWCELWDGETGWFRVDPTPGNNRMVVEQQVTVNLGAPVQIWGDWIESLRMAYYRRVIGFDAQSQRELAEKPRNWLRSFFAGRDPGSWRSWFDFERKESDPDASIEPRRDHTKPLMVVVFLLTFWLAWRMIRDFRRRSGSMHPVRYRAARWLKDPRMVSHELHAQLLCLRFGPVELWPDPVVVFRKCRRECATPQATGAKLP
jgi:protein-glutamine gamma-glutamyltransferase